jgi:uncharacterized protein with HEPN domain
MSKRDPELLIKDILESISKIQRYSSALSIQEFLSDEKTFDAIIRNFEIIGEAASRLPEDFKDRFPDIDWARIRGFRNRIVHDYMGIDSQIVWTIITKYLPILKEKLESIRF